MQLLACCPLLPRQAALTGDERCSRLQDVGVHTRAVVPVCLVQQLQQWRSNSMVMLTWG
jgi:hypothetical protein